jgi:hypothetical protein
MTNTHKLKRQRKEYLNNARWHCPQSPTEAHYWIIPPEGGESVCKHCGTVREFQNEEVGDVVSPIFDAVEI